jgi:hypothetical protein
MCSWLAPGGSSGRPIAAQPNRHLLRGGVILTEVVLHVIVDERVTDVRGKLGVARGEAQVENIGVPKALRRQTPFKDPNQGVPVLNLDRSQL